ncbi:RNA-binding protein [Ktedonosporobacter rubrisoli]|uniref:RNA-binding protein n=1 Tax=Ktedonosporobacter rubrisoli TaxID=2509675 RepID=A0A4V0YZI7_KTERU|nr:RNA-binding protein [Ktedonosporobacter rubrisoli]QBD79861.1 RNA-binding protein [Ktedonosporobacter rubrisoli]
MRLYVGGLPYQTTEDDLNELFAPKGQVKSVSVIIDRDTGRSKGFGFVEMDNDEDARRAIDELNGTSLGNRTITVNEARERPAGGNRGGYQSRDRRGGGGGGYRDNNYRGGSRY